MNCLGTEAFTVSPVLPSSSFTVEKYDNKMIKCRLVLENKARAAGRQGWRQRGAQRRRPEGLLVRIPPSLLAPTAEHFL